MQENNEKTLLVSKLLGDLIRDLRKGNAQLSLDRLANAYGISKGTLSAVENGSCNAKFITILKISQAMGIKCSTLIKMLEDKLGEKFTLIEE